MIGTIDDPRVLVTVGTACGAAAHDVRERLDKAAVKEAEGQAGTREEVSTEAVVEAIDAIGASLQEHLGHESDQTAQDGRRIRIEFSTEKAPQGEENAFGLDLGIRIIIETPGYLAHKAILVQCKRMFGSGRTASFAKLREDGEKQARDMLSVSPASFFFLFNSGAPDALLRMMMLLPAVLLWTPDGPWSCAPYLDPGVSVLPATRVLAMSDAAKAAGTKMPISAPEVLAGSVPLGHFIVGLFGPCMVGDPRLPVLQLATPPKRRKGMATGLDAPVPALGGLEPKRFFEFRFTKEGGTGKREPRRRKHRG